MLAEERARWETMKNDLQASSMTAAPLLEQTHQAAQRSLPSNVLIHSNNSLSPHRRQCETASFPPISVAKEKPPGSKWKLSFDWTTFDVQATAQYRQSLKLQYWNVLIKQRFKLMVLLSMVHIIEYHFHLSDRMIIFHLPHKEKFDVIIFLLSRGLCGRVQPSGHVGRVAKGIDSASASD
mmetsp:Transcript_20548/g.37342  ORF Transcript_20548/g.37342 Transcript_20548/m.37342 type:complete len:180 (+) Transcript_20548:354-893(+)